MKANQPEKPGPARARRQSGFLSLAVALALTRTAGAEDPVPAILRDIKADLPVIYKLRDDLVGRARARPAPATRPVVITLEFPRLLATGEASHNMPVTLRRDGNGNWLPGRGRPGLADAVDASGLVLSSHGTSLEGDLRIQLAPTSGPFRERVEATLTLQARIRAGTVTGRFDTPGHEALPRIPRFDCRGTALFSPLPGRSGEVTGTLRPVEAEFEEPPKPVFNLAGSVSIPLAEAEGLHRAACELYRQAHAAALVVQTGLDLPYALEMTPVYRPRWPQPATAEAAADRAGPPAVPTLDVDLDLEADGPPAAPKLAPAQTSCIINSLEKIRSHVRRLREALERFAAESREPAARVTAGDAGVDPDFGPWFGEAVLPVDGAGRNLLDRVEPDAPSPEWRAAISWGFAGPFPRLTRTVVLPTLPEVIPAPDARMVVDPGLESLIDAVCREAPPTDEDVPESAPPRSTYGLGDGYVWVPMGRNLQLSQSHFCPPLSVYAVADLVAPADGTFWAGLNLKDSGALWVEERLVWTGPTQPDPDSIEHVYRFPLPLRQGVNRLVLRVDRLHNASFFALRICTRGRPRDVTAGEAPRNRSDLPPNVFHGWRGDGGGIFPDARPPIAWDLESERNVRWEIPLGNSQATPLILGDRLFVLEDAATLLCFEAKSGRLLWRRTNEPEAADPAVQAEIQALQARAEELAAEIAELGPTPLARRRTLEKRGLPPAQAGENLSRLITSFGKQFEDLKGIYKSKLRLSSSWAYYISLTFGTPVTDGKRIWFCSNAGIVACYDLDGNRLWAVTHPWNTGVDYTFSPLLAGGRLIVVFNGRSPAGMDGSARLKTARYFLAGYDPDTGELEWTVNTAPGGQGQICGTPAIVRLRDGAEPVDVVVTADGSVVRARDGKLLRKHIGVRERYGSPLADGDRVIISGSANIACYELLFRDRQLGTRLRWHRPRHGTLYDSGDYRLVRDGVLFEYGARLDAMDAETGLLLSSSPNVLYREPLRCYPPLAWANGHLYVGDLGTGAGMKKWSFVPGALTAATAESTPLVLARNRVGNLCASPAAHGDCLYLRQWYSLVCLGFTGMEGERFEAETVAREVLSTLPPSPPGREQPLDIDLSEARRLEGARAATLVPGMLSGDWWYVGPVARDRAAAIERALREESLDGLAAVHERSTLVIAGTPVPIEPIVNVPTEIEQAIRAQHHVTKAKVSFREHMDRLRALAPPAWTSTLPGAPYREIQLKTNAVPGNHKAYLVGLFTVPLPGPVRWEEPGPDTRAWIAGREVRHGQLVTVPEGGLSAVVELGADATGRLRRFRPCFWPSRGPEADRKTWRAEVNRRRPYLERALALTEDATLQARIRAVLSESGP